MAIILYDDVFLEHNTGSGHPENAQRLLNTTKYLKSTGLWSKTRLVKPAKSTIENINVVHDKKYIDQVELLSEKGGGMVDPDTVVSSNSFKAALFAAGAGITAIDNVMDGSCKSAFCLVRPPGHHAIPLRGMGFCLFNNVAVSVKYLQSKYKIERILIVDWDVHHGNGTQDVFYDDPSVLFFSIHRYPFYPGSGSEMEKGNGSGYGYTINVPLSYGIESAEYISKFKEVIDGKAKEFSPQFIIISAGFDAYIDDPVGGLGLEIADFADLTKIVVQLAQECCENRIVSCLEGGYNLTDLPKCIEAHLGALP
ncbi:MAG: histone deacetylase family protein [Candidatus Anammoxibacter sp.]